ncbi:low molecular weight protein tyrosine phosphatase family protein [Paenibacillus sp. NPDC056579]|uniref:low molecular weight protein tyrosine phosphatase family protein n=1 Tax=unclassified Paenibacillus TaxID=185978 RepID=UPI001EF9656B|nr:protein tyrosine phosphatase [Paenibacillus sp. H1-7]ULL16125.1 protein tyrosine phosphatase [Paenibacillus sp. H1-7]
MKLLFVCSRNKWRSLTAEKIFEGYNGYEVKSAGTEDSARIKVTEGHIGWADLIFAMEKKHIRRLQDKFPYKLAGKNVICLDIQDDYQFMDEDLIEVLKSRVSEHIDIPE